MPFFIVDAKNNITNIDWEVVDGQAVEFDRGFDGSISISNVQKRHEGRYRCILTTQYDSSNATVSVEVEANAPVLIKHSDNQTVFSGDGVLLICNAEGIPKPSITWKFNNTNVVQPVSEEEYKILHAIHSDTGLYTCIAKNKYGETKKDIFVRVLTLPVIKKEIIVKNGDNLELPCIDDRGISGVTYIWQKNNELVSQDMIQPNGSILLNNISETSDTGIYSCIISIEGRNKTLTSKVQTKSNIIFSDGGYKRSMEGDSITLACNILWDSRDVKRLWKYNDKFIDDSLQRNMSNEDRRYLELQNLKLSDAGKYSCIASLGDGKRHTITFSLEVVAKPKIFKGCETGIDDVLVSKLNKEEGNESTRNTSAAVSWKIPENLNRSCYQEIVLRWWTNDSNQFYDVPYNLTTTKAIIEDLNFNSGYYVQVILITPGRFEVLGLPKSFALSKLKQLSQSGMETIFHGGGLDTAIIIIIVAAFVSSSFLIIIAIIIYRNKKKGKSAPQENSLMRGTAGRCCYSLCKCLIKSDDDPYTGKTNFNGFDRGAYHDRIIPLDVDSGGFTSSNRSGDNGFMRNLTPQWPEPEEQTLQTSASDDQEENEPFLEHRYSTFAPIPDVKQGNNKHINSSNNHFGSHNPSSKGGRCDPLIGLRRNSKTSISSSWSSLFNVPTSNTSTVKTTPSPNRKSIANVESTFTPRKRP